MRRADRLFRIVQRLRRRGATTASELAAALEVAPRTIYRDIQDLMTSGVPIQGEPGVGYALPKSFEMPPLMFSDEEIEALVLGARMVQAWADKRLARAAEEALQKIEAALPERLRDRLDEAAFLAPDFHISPAVARGLDEIRRALRERRRLAFGYVDKGGAASLRVVRPLGVTFWGQAWTLAAWCESREGFRSFRLDRIRSLEVREVFPEEPGKLLRDYLALRDAEPKLAK